MKVSSGALLRFLYYVKERKITHYTFISVAVICALGCQIKKKEKKISGSRSQVQEKGNRNGRERGVKEG